MKSRNNVKAFIVIVIIAALALIGWFGIPSLNIPSIAGTRTGIDIQGGIAVTLQPGDGVIPTTSQLQTAKYVIESRLDSQAVFDRNIAIDDNGGRILVEIPFKSDQNSGNLLTSDYDMQKTVVEYIGKTANLTFRPVDESRIDEEASQTRGMTVYEMIDPVLVAGENVTDSTVQMQQGKTNANQIVVSLKFDNIGTQQFADATREYKDKKIAIFMDDIMLTAPTVNAVITNGEAIIEGGFTHEHASELSAQIRSGSLPFKLEPSELTQITPLLGEGALEVTVRAGIIAFILIIIFMCVFYRLPGFVSAVALFGLMTSLLVVIAVSQSTLTLPGIAGIILTAGMGVDANVIIFERIKEELLAGKTIKSAIDTGFKNAFSAILDSNVTTLIASVVLYFLGTGPIKGFAVTLTLGVLLSFVSAITVTRIVLKAVTETKIGKKKSLYGI